MEYSGTITRNTMETKVGTRIGENDLRDYIAIYHREDPTTDDNETIW